MRVERGFASSQNAPIVGDPAPLSIAGKPAEAAARASAKIQGDAIDYAQRRQERDASVIVADTLTSIQEETAKDYYNAQRNTVSSTTQPDPDKSIDSLSLMVNMPGADVNADYNKKPFTDYILGSFDQRTKERLAKISNPLARAELEKRLSYFRASLTEDALGFEARATLDLRKELIGTSAERMSRMILNNPETFDDNLIQLNTFVDKARIGITTPELKRQMAGGLAMSAAEGWISTDPNKAKELLHGNDASFVQYLKPEQIVALRSKAEGRISQLGAEERTNLASLEQDHERSLLETGEGIPGFEARVKKAFAETPQVVENKLADYAVAKSAYTHKTVIDSLPLNKLSEYVAKQRPPAGDTQYSEKAKVADYLGNLAATQIKLAAEDPAALADTLLPDEAEKLSPDDFQGRANFRLAMQERKGISEAERRILTNSERDGMASAIQSAPPDQVLSVIQDLVQKFDQAAGDRTPLSPRLFKELTAKGGLDASYSVLLQNVRDGSPVAFDLVRTMKLRKELGERLSQPEDKKKLYETIDAEMENFSESFLLGSPENLGALSQLREVTYNLANMYAVDKGLSIGDSAKKAVKALVRDKIEAIDGALIVPRYVETFNKGRMPLTKDHVLQGYSKAKADLLSGRRKYGQELTFGGAPKWATPEIKKDLIGEALKRGYWKTTADFSGAHFMVPLMGGDLPLLDENGQNLFIPFESAQVSGAFSDLREKE